MSNSTNLSELRYDKVIDLAEERFKKIAPPEIDFAKERGFAIQLLENNEYLKKVAMENKVSLLQAVTNVAAIGLSLNPAKKQAYLIPRSVKVGNGWETRVFLDIGYGGMLDVATSTGIIKWVQARPVYKTDTFLDNGLDKEPTHTYDPFIPSSERGEFVGVYCTAKTSDGDYLTTTMTAAEINDIKMRSELGKKDKGPWATDFIEQAKKTVIRRAFKTWPHTKEMERMEHAVHIGNENEGFQPIVNNPEISEFTADQKSYYDQLITANNEVEMYTLSRTLPEGAWISLYHSFEKGSKGKYQRIVDELVAKGSAIVQECAQSLSEAAERHDEVGAREILDDLSNASQELILAQAGDDAKDFWADIGNRNKD